MLWILYNTGSGALAKPDRFGRTVAEVYANGQLVQLQQVKDGMAWAYLRSIQGQLSTMERNRESFYRSSLEPKGNFRGKPDATLGMATAESVVFDL